MHHQKNPKKYNYTKISPNKLKWIKTVDGFEAILIFWTALELVLNSVRWIWVVWVFLGEAKPQKKSLEKISLIKINQNESKFVKINAKIVQLYQN